MLPTIAVAAQAVGYAPLSTGAGDWGQAMLHQVAPPISDAIEFFLSIPNWLDDTPTGTEFAQMMLKPELSRSKTRRPRD